MKYRPIVLCLIVLSLSILMNSCFEIWACRCNKKDFAKSLYNTDCTPLTANELQSMILEDTTYYKALLFYSPCCGGSLARSKYYKQVYELADTNTTKVYFIIENCSGIKYAKQFLNSYQIYPDHYYYIRDTEPPFNYTFSRDTTVIPKIEFMRSTFENASQVDEGSGMTVSMFVNPRNELKLLRIIAPENNLECLSSLRAEYLENFDITKLDYSVIDTMYVSSEDADFAIPDYKHN